MENKPEKKVLASQPKDRSLDAYKLWMKDIYKQFTTNKDKIKLTEEDWIANWKEYWEEKSKE